MLYSLLGFCVPLFLLIKFAPSGVSGVTSKFVMQIFLECEDNFWKGDTTLIKHRPRYFFSLRFPKKIVIVSHNFSFFLLCVNSLSYAFSLGYQ